MTDDTIPTYLEATGDSIYYQQSIEQFGRNMELALGVNSSFGSLILSLNDVESVAPLSADEMRRLASALLDASDAIDNVKRSGVIKYRNPNS